MNFGNVRFDLEHDKKFVEKKKDTEGNWQQYDKPISHFGNTFGKVLPEKYVGALNSDKNSSLEAYGEAFRQYIEDTLSASLNKHRTAIEFGGPGSNFFSGFSENFFEKTVGVCLDDIRPAYKKEYDEEHGHSVIAGDLLDTKNKELFKQITDSIGTSKTDLIVSRLMGPLEDLSRNPLVLDRIIRKWYSILNDNGILIAQFQLVKQHHPVVEERHKKDEYDYLFMDTQEDVENWAKKVKEKYGDQIEVQVARGVIRIHKNPGAPEELMTSKELFPQG